MDKVLCTLHFYVHFFVFLRRGDKLIQINGLNLQDLTPEELTEILAEGSPQLVSWWASQRFITSHAWNYSLLYGEKLPLLLHKITLTDQFLTLLQKVHKASKKKKKKQPEQAFPAEDILHPMSKESTLLSFYMEMRREEHLEENHVRQGEEERTEENRENGEGGELLIVSMKKTRVSVLTGRGLADDVDYHDVVLVAESSTVMHGE